MMGKLIDIIIIIILHTVYPLWQAWLQAFGSSYRLAATQALDSYHVAAQSATRIGTKSRIRSLVLKQIEEMCLSFRSLLILGTLIQTQTGSPQLIKKKRKEKKVDYNHTTKNTYHRFVF